MKRLALTLFSLAASAVTLLAQSEILPGASAPPPCGQETVSTTILRGVLTGTGPGSAVATIRTHLASDPSRYGVDFIADYAFPQAVGVTAFQIHSGGPGQTGAVALDSGISAMAPVAAQSGSGTIQTQISGLTGASSPPVADIANNPGQYYVEIDTAAGILRGQLAPVRQSVAIALMDQLREVPSIGGIGAATGFVAATVTRDSSGALSSAELNFAVNYNFPAAVTITGLELRSGPAGATGPAVIALPIANAQAAASGSWTARIQADLTQPAVTAAVDALFSDPSGYYLNLVTTANPAGAARGQLARAASNTLAVSLCAIPRFIAQMDDADVGLTVAAVRSPDGGLQAAWVTFDAAYNLSPNESITYLGIPHDALHTSPSSSNPLKTASGVGNIYESVPVSSSVALKQLENILLGVQESMELLTADNITLQGPAPVFTVSGPLAINGIQSGAGDPAALPAAPGGLISIFGTFPGGLPDFAAADVTGLYNQPWPVSLNGTWVTIGGRSIPVGYHSGGQIDAQVPDDLTPGVYEVRYWASGALLSLGGPSQQDQPDYRSDPYLLTVSPQAPAIFVSAGAPVIVHGATGALVSQTAPAAAGETVLIYATGVAGVLPPPGSFGAFLYAPPMVSATVGTIAVSAVPIFGAPGYTGLEIATLTIPAGITGTQTLTLQVNGAASNPVPLFVK